MATRSPRRGRDPAGHDAACAPAGPWSAGGPRTESATSARCGRATHRGGNPGYHVGKANVYPVAERLRAKGIPFFFASGAEAYQIVPAFKDVPLVHKPYRIDQVYALLDQVLGLTEP